MMRSFAERLENVSSRPVNGSRSDEGSRSSDLVFVQKVANPNSTPDRQQAVKERAHLLRPHLSSLCRLGGEDFARGVTETVGIGDVQHPPYHGAETHDVFGLSAFVSFQISHPLQIQVALCRTHCCVLGIPIATARKAVEFVGNPMEVVFRYFGMISPHWVIRPQTKLVSRCYHWAVSSCCASSQSSTFW